MPNPNSLVPNQTKGYEHERIVRDQSGDAHYFGMLPGDRSRTITPEEVLRNELAALEAAAALAVASATEPTA